MQDNPSYLSAQKISKELGISERKVWDLIHDPDRPIPHFRIGKKIVRVRAADLHKWMDENARVDESRVDRLVDEVMGQ